MSNKFMKVKRVVMSAITCVILVSQLVGCSAMNSTEMMDLLNSGSDVEITMAIPNNVKTEVKEHRQEFIWEELEQLKTYNEEFRVKFDKIFDIDNVTEEGKNGKNGCMYINEEGERDGNTTISDSLRNKVFMEEYMEKSEVTDKIAELASGIYADIDTKSNNAVYAGLNAYFNLFNESKDQDIYFNANQSLTREDFYSLIYRIDNKVTDLSENETFNSKVGTTGGGNRFAAQTEKYAWLNIENEGLRPGNYKSAITKAEAIYLIMNKYFPEEMKQIDKKEIALKDANDGGDLLTVGKDKLQITDKESKEEIVAKAWQLGILAKMQQGTKGYVHEDIYKALGAANKLGLVGTETNWNGPITKAGAIDLVVKLNKIQNKTEGYKTTTKIGTMKKEEAAGSEEGMPLWVKSKVSLRVEPSTDARSIKTVEIGDKVLFVELYEDNDWIKVKHGEDSGYIETDNAGIEKPDTPVANKQVQKPTSGQNKPTNSQNKPTQTPVNKPTQNQSKPTSGQSKPSQNKPVKKPTQQQSKPAQKPTNNTNKGNSNTGGGKTNKGPIMPNRILGDGKNSEITKDGGVVDPDRDIKYELGN